jgi:hypothetical protein
MAYCQRLPILSRTVYSVVADLQDAISCAPLAFGPFERIDSAEACIVALAQRNNVLSARLIKHDRTGNITEAIYGE